MNDWHTCSACGKRTYHSRKSAKGRGGSLGHRMRTYPACEGTGWHATSESAARTTFFRDLGSGIEPEVMDLRYSGASLLTIAETLSVSPSVVNSILREHDPQAVRH